MYQHDFPDPEEGPLPPGWMRSYYDTPDVGDGSLYFTNYSINACTLGGLFTGTHEDDLDRVVPLMQPEDQGKLSFLTFPPAWPPQHLQLGRTRAGLPPYVARDEPLPPYYHQGTWWTGREQGPLPRGWRRSVIRVEEHLIQLGCNYADFTYRFIGDGVDGAPLWQNLIGTPFYANAAADEYVFADCAPLSELYFDQGFNQNDVEEDPSSGAVGARTDGFAGEGDLLDDFCSEDSAA